MYVEGGDTLGFARSSLNLRYYTSGDSDLTTIGTVSLAVPCLTRYLIHRLVRVILFYFGCLSVYYSWVMLRERKRGWGPLKLS